MKKVIAILGISLFSMMVFTNSNVLASGNDLDLASLITLNKADAECSAGITLNGRCNFTGERCYASFNPGSPDNNCDYAVSYW